MSMPYDPRGQQPYYPSPQNGLGTGGFVCGLVGLIFSFVPIIGLVAWPLVIVGVVLSAIGVSKANRQLANNKGLATAGVVLSIIGLVICFMWLTPAFYAHY